jgi:hypothetical protein
MVDEGGPEEIDLIVVGFDEKNRVVASPTSSLGSLQLSSIKGLEARYEDYYGTIWIGSVAEVVGDAAIIEFEKMKMGEWPAGLGLGSLIRVSKP